MNFIKRFQALSDQHLIFSYTLPSTIVLLYLIIAAMRHLPVHWFIGTTLAIVVVIEAILFVVTFISAMSISIENHGWWPENKDD